MRSYIPRKISRTPWLIVASFAGLLLGTGPSRADRFRADPVEELRLALRASLQSLELDPEVAKSVLNAPPENRLRLLGDARNKVLAKKVGAIRSIGDMRRALLLQDWGGELRDERYAADRTNRTLLVRRFQESMRHVLQSKSEPAKLGVMRILTEVADMRTEADPEAPGISRAFTADLVRIVKTGESAAIRMAAARTLGQIFADPDKAVPALRDMLANGSLAEQRAAATGLLDMIRTVIRLSAASKPTPTKVEATHADVISAGRQIVSAVRVRLTNTEDTETRRLCVEAVQQTAAALVNLMPHASRTGEGLELGEDRRVIEAARGELQPLMKALSDEAPQLGQLVVEDRNPAIRLLARRALEDMGAAYNRLQRAAASLSAVIGTGTETIDQPPDLSPSSEEQEQAGVPKSAAKEKDVLLQGLKTAVPQLAKGVSDPDLKARLAAIDVLETLGPAAAPAAPALVKALSDRNRFVRWAAARTLGRIGPVKNLQAVRPLARLLRDQDIDLASAAAVALERYGPAAKSAVPDLIRAMKASDATMRVNAMRALDGIGTDATPAIPALTAALRDPNQRVRQLAAEVLGRFGPLASQSEEPLRVALNDPVAEVRRAAGDALLNILPTEK